MGRPQVISWIDIDVLKTSFKRLKEDWIPVPTGDTQCVPKITELFGYRIRYTLYYL